MHDEQLRDLLRTLETERVPSAAFADTLYGRLTLGAGAQPPRRAPWALLAAATLLLVLAAGVAVGSGWVRVPVTVDASTSAAPSSSAVALASPSARPSSSAGASPSPSSSVEPSAAPDPALVGAILFAEADGLRIRSEPSGEGEVLATLRRGQLMGATGEQRSVDDTEWYEVRIGPGELAGWVAAGPGGSWLRLVEDGAVTFRCDGCADDGPRVVSVTPLGDANLTTIGDEDLTEWRWSPDGSRLVASLGGTTLPYRIVTLAPDGMQLDDLGVGVAGAWSPDGSRLAWLGEGGLVVTDSELIPTELDLDTGRAGAPRWSPDGSRIAFGAIDCPECPQDEPIMGDPPGATWLVGADGSNLRKVTGGDYSGLVDWSPDGSTLAFVQHDLSGEFPSRAYLMPIVGGDRRYLLDGGAVQAAGLWSPAGTQLAVATPEGIILTDGEENGAAQLVTTSAVIGAVRWSPSGNWLVYSASDGPDVGLWIVPVDGSEEPRRISPVDATANTAEWQPILVELP
ncbi:MAG: SH3 domain-containing protein [Chloroflexota bacterium]|nr:SH3 domain-containing protein [Chloroflexota bacterium]